jgi:hypothetical protein
MQRRTPDQVPTAAAEQQPIGPTLVRHFLPFDGPAIADPHTAPLGQGVDQLVVDPFVGRQLVRRFQPDLDRRSGRAELAAQPVGQGTLELEGSRLGGTEEGQMRMLAEIAAKDDQGERFFGREIGGRQIIVRRNSVPLFVLVEDQRYSRLPKDVQIPKDRPSAHLTGLGKSVNVLTSSSLKQPDQLQQAPDS